MRGIMVKTPSGPFGPLGPIGPRLPLVVVVGGVVVAEIARLLLARSERKKVQASPGGCSEPWSQPGTN